MIPFRFGRADVPNGVANNVSSIPSDPNAPIQDILSGFQRMGLSNLDALVLISGSHSLG